MKDHRYRTSYKRGVALLLALIAIMVSAIVGVSFLTSQSTSIGIASNIANTASARYVAETGMMLTLIYLETSNDWRTSKSNGVWLTSQSFGDGSYDVKVEDGQDTNGDGVISVPTEGDGDLADNFGEQITVTVTGKVANCQHISRVVVTPKFNPKNILYAVGNPSSLTSIEGSRKTLMESWTWTVSLIDDDATQAEYDAAICDADAALVSDSATSLSTKLKEASIGVVNEQGLLYPTFGLSSKSNKYNDSNSGNINIVNNTHYITQPFSTGTLTIGPVNVVVWYLDDKFAGSLVTLAQRVGDTRRVLSTLETGEALQSGGVAAGRRVYVPFANISSSNLTADGQTILKRALSWTDQSSSAGSFGFNTILPKATDKVNGKQVATCVTLPENGTLTAIAGYLDSRSKKIRYAIYSDSGGEPGTRLAQSNVYQTTKSGPNWHRINITPLTLTAGTYWLALALETSDMKYRFRDKLGKIRYSVNNAITGNFTNTWGISSYTANRQVNLYGVYTPASGGANPAEGGTYYIDSDSIDWRE